MSLRVRADSLSRWARQRLRGRRGARYGRFRLSERLRRRERALVRDWVNALDPRLLVRLPELEVVSAVAIVRVGEKILLDADGRARGALPPRGDRSTQAVAYVRDRVVVLHRRLFRQRWLGQRLFYHELCHFLWPRLGARARRRFILHLQREWARRVRGELGYSAEYRKACLRRQARLAREQKRARGDAWREYACESFCDTGAFLLAQTAGLGRRLASVEFSLAPRHRPARLGAWLRAVAWTP